MSGSTIVSTSAPANPIPGLQWWNPTADRLFIFDGAAWVEPNTNYTYPWDEDAVNYIYAIEAADNQYLEKDTQKAINNFVLGCKADLNWDAIKGSCIFAGARTLEGALTPLAGTAPTNFNFTIADYNRKTGLKGASGKYLSTNRTIQSDPINSRHIYAYVSEAATSANVIIMSDANGSQKWGINYIRPSFSISRPWWITNSGVSYQYTLTNQNDAGGFGVARLPLTETTATAKYLRDQSYLISASATNPSSFEHNNAIQIFRDAINPVFFNGRISFYSTGEAVDLLTLNNRVGTLMSELQLSIV